MNLRDDQGRPEPPLASGEAETLVGFLEYQRATFAWKWSGLEAAGLKVTLGASTMTLGGMLKHLAYYEDIGSPTACGATSAKPCGATTTGTTIRTGVELGHRGLPPEAAHPLAGRGVPLPRSALRDPGGRRP